MQRYGTVSVFHEQLPLWGMGEVYSRRNFSGLPSKQAGAWLGACSVELFLGYANFTMHGSETIGIFGQMYGNPFSSLLLSCGCLGVVRARGSLCPPRDSVAYSDWAGVLRRDAVCSGRGGGGGGNERSLRYGDRREFLGGSQG